MQSRAKVKVDLIFGVEGEGDEIKSGVYLCVRNLSSHDVHLSNLSILYPYRSYGIKERFLNLWKYRRFARRLGWVSTSLSNYSIEDGCPMCLGPRKSHSVLITDDMLLNILEDASEKNLIGCVQDQLWKNTYSSVFKDLGYVGQKIVEQSCQIDSPLKSGERNFTPQDATDGTL